MSEKRSFSSPSSLEATETLHGREAYDDNDVLGHEEEHHIKYKTLSWELVAVLKREACSLALNNEGEKGPGTFKDELALYNEYKNIPSDMTDLSNDDTLVKTPAGGMPTDVKMNLRWREWEVT